MLQVLTKKYLKINKIMKHYQMKFIQFEYFSLQTELKWKLVGLNNYILGIVTNFEIKAIY